jgi:hypothetical protein
LNKLF